MKGKTCCITGHRDVPDQEINSIKKALHQEIKKAVKDGFTVFLSGFADGVDQYFAEIVFSAWHFPLSRTFAALGL